MLLKNLINNLPEGKKKITIRGLSTNSQEVKKGYIFLPLKGIIITEKNILKMRSIRARLQLFVQISANIQIKKLL